MSRKSRESCSTQLPDGFQIFSSRWRPLDPEAIGTRQNVEEFENSLERRRRERVEYRLARVRELEPDEVEESRLEDEL